MALIFGEYLNALWILVYGEPFNRVILYSVAMATIWGLTWVNLYGVHLSGMSFKMAPLPLIAAKTSSRIGS